MYVKVINTSNEPRHVEFAFIGLKKKETVKAVECVKFHSDFLYQDNTLDAPEQVVPVKASFSGEGKPSPPRWSRLPLRSTSWRGKGIILLYDAGGRQKRSARPMPLPVAPKRRL